MNSAGVMTPPRGAITSDGYDLQWGTNCLGHYIFTETLLPTLISTAANKPPGTVRIITTSSSAHTMAVKGGVNMVDLTQGQFRLLLLISAADSFFARSKLEGFRAVRSVEAGKHHHEQLLGEEARTEWNYLHFSRQSNHTIS